MDGSAVEHKKRRRRFCLGLVVVAVLIVVVVVAFFAFRDLGVRDPLLYSDALTVQVLTDKSLYVQGEDVTISVYVINGKNEAIVQPTMISYKVLDSTGQEVYSVHVLITLPNPPPTFPAHSKSLCGSHVWSQKNSNYALVEPGNYKVEASLENGASECQIVIAAR